MYWYVSKKLALYGEAPPALCFHSCFLRSMSCVLPEFEGEFFVVLQTPPLHFDDSHGRRLVVHPAGSE